MKKVSTLYLKVLPYITQGMLLVIATYSALAFSSLVKIPYSNPANIANQFNILGFNPNTNYAQLIFVTIGAPLLYLILRKVYSKNPAHWSIKLLGVTVLLFHFVSTEIIKFGSGYAFGQGALDTFHSGEQLSPTLAFLSGSHLYSDLFFFRGAGTDVLLAASGMKFFGENIGGFILGTHTYMILTILAFFALLAFFIRNSLVYILAIIGLYTSASVVLNQPRDIPVLLVFLLLFIVLKPNILNNTRKLALGLIGFVSGLEMYIAIDRGMSLIGLSILFTIFLCILPSTKNNGVALPRSLKSLFTRKNSLAAINRFKDGIWIMPTSLLVGMFVPALFLGPAEFISYLKMSFIDVPNFGGLLVAQPFPSFFTPGYLMWGPVIIVVITIIIYTQLLYSHRGRVINKILPLGLLLAYSIVALKFGSNRIDIAKMASVAAPLYITSTLIIAASIKDMRKIKSSIKEALVPVILGVTALIFFSSIQLQSLFTQPYATLTDVKTYWRTVRSSDDIWLNQNLKDVRDYIVKKTTKDDYIFSLSADPIYYYLSNRKNPTRFYISWYADPQPYTDEVLKSLKQNKPSLVIYKNGGPWDKPDNVPMTDRIPEVNKWILDNYTKKTTIGDTIILEH